ncbi:MFS transporter [Aphanomyces euteiches]|nr:MFS transporter [Aphanomyces euteiches]
MIYGTGILFLAPLLGCVSGQCSEGILLQRHLRDKMANKIESDLSLVLLPEIVLRMAFFIQEWETLVDFLLALRPANVIGPLQGL